MSRIAFSLFAFCLSIGLAHAETTTNRFATVDGIKIFYREAGDPSLPTILLLHGFPSSSHMFRELMPKLSANFHVLAPDYPGMGFSEAPDEKKFTPTFDNVADIMEKLVAQLGEKHLILYEQDFGGPVGMRLAVHHPDWVSGLIIQNTPITLDSWDATRLAGIVKAADASLPEQRKAAENRVVPATATFLYQHGSRNPSALDPASWAVDTYVMANTDSRRIMADLLVDLPSNFAQYPVWEAYLRKNQPKTLVVWGKADPSFALIGADAVKRFVPDAEIHYYETGHFALEEDVDDIARQIISRFAAPAAEKPRVE